jgi:hypothetical protein
MPTLLIIDGFRFFFYSNDHLPMHVHVRGKDGEAKFLLEPVMVESCYGLSVRDLRKIEKIISDNQSNFIESWKQYFNQ